MKLFGKKKRTVHRPRQEELAGRIAGRIVRVQQRMADYLNGWTRHLSHRWKLLYLLLFCLLFTAINLWLPIGSITH